MVSKFRMLYPRQQAAAEQTMRWMVTQLYSDVALRSTSSRWAARVSVARLQSAGAGSSLEIKRDPLGAHLSVGTYWWTTASPSPPSPPPSPPPPPPPPPVSYIVSKYKLPRQVDSTWRTRDVSSLPDQGQSAWARTLGSYPQCSALGAPLRGARPQQE